MVLDDAGRKYQVLVVALAVIDDTCSVDSVLLNEGQDVVDIATFNFVEQLLVERIDLTHCLTQIVLRRGLHWLHLHPGKLTIRLGGMLIITGQILGR